MEKQIILTREDYNKKREDLNELKTTGRDDIAEKIKVARSFGDLSENAEYDEAMNEQAKLEATIAQLESELRNAQILDEKSINTKAIHIGSKVTILDVEYNEKFEYTITGQSDFENGKISDQSPVGQALLGKTAGAVVDVHVPSGKVVQYKVLSISK